MWIKGWTDDEERLFADIMSVSRLSRIQAIQLWKRCRENAAKAVRLAAKNYPRPTEAQLAGLRNANEVRSRARKAILPSANGSGRAIPEVNGVACGMRWCR